MRRILTAATAVILVVLCACGGGSDESSASTASTTLPGTTTEPPATTTPEQNRFCVAAESLLTEVATLPVDDLESLREGANEAVRLIDEMEANATGRMARTVLVLKSAATRMKDIIDDADDLEGATAGVASLSTENVAEATERVTEFLESDCGG